MWVFTPLGFFSITAHETGLQVRARNGRHLVDLAKYGVERKIWKRQPDILKNVGTDYPYRFYASHFEVSTLLHQVCWEIEYQNFKSECHRVRADRPFLDALQDVWARLLRLEREETRNPTRSNYRFWP